VVLLRQNDKLRVAEFIDFRHWRTYSLGEDAACGTQCSSSSARCFLSTLAGICFGVEGSASFLGTAARHADTATRMEGSLGPGATHQ